MSDPDEITRSLPDEAAPPAYSDRAGSSASPLGIWAHLELIAKVGEGGFGETFRARDSRLEREVALKLLKAEASRDAELGGRVVREGALLARIRHPNVVTVYGAERFGGRVGLWMEFVRGRTLDSLVAEKGPLDLRE